ncbi:hypothetical protein ACKI10_15145 [Streptomyces galilaeus]|uniref:Uncharacterized protein n=1 Tax=Streptomyces galilaeus TaxID=33899 RepID=A0ABW9IJ99_STRGJ
MHLNGKVVFCIGPDGARVAAKRLNTGQHALCRSIDSALLLASALQRSHANGRHRCEHQDGAGGYGCNDLANTGHH